MPLEGYTPHTLSEMEISHTSLLTAPLGDLTGGHATHWSYTPLPHTWEADSPCTTIGISCTSHSRGFSGGSLPLHPAPPRPGLTTLLICVQCLCLLLHHHYHLILTLCILHTADLHCLHHLCTHYLPCTAATGLPGLGGWSLFSCCLPGSAWVPLHWVWGLCTTLPAHTTAHCTTLHCTHTPSLPSPPSAPCPHLHHSQECEPRTFLHSLTTLSHYTCTTTSPHGLWRCNKINSPCHSDYR